MEAKHTPGPWHVGHDRTGTLLIVAGDGENFDGGPWVYDSDKPEARPMSDANARLIAAAPTMYAALLEVKRLRDLWRSQDDAVSIDSIAYMDGLDRIDVDAVIAGAKGS